MLRFTLREIVRLLSGLVGAAFLAAALAALSSPIAAQGGRGFGMSLIDHVRAFASLDFGVSAVSGRAAVLELAERLPPTLIVIAAGAAIAIAIGAPLGILLGAGPVRRAAAPLIQIVAAAPVFCGALALAYVAQHFGWPARVHGTNLPQNVLAFDPARPLDALRPLVLPALTVGAAGAALVQLVLRTASAEVAREPYRRGLRRLGLSALEIERAYVAPQVLAALASSFGELALALIAAAAVAEWVFDVPGAAVLFVKSVALSDWTMAALVLVLFSLIALTADFAGRLGARAIAGDGASP